MAQHKFGTCRRAMLSFERQPFPAPCHVDQDVAHSRAWRALRHLTTFDRVLSALHRRNHLPVPPGPCTQPMLPRGSRCGQHLSRPEYTLGPIVTFAPQHTLRALRVRTLCAARSPAGFRVISKARSTSPAAEKGRGIGCRALRPHGKLPRPDYSEASGPIELGRRWDPMPGPSRIGSETETDGTA